MIKEPIDLDQKTYFESFPEVTVVFTKFDGVEIRKQVNAIEAHFEITTNILLGVAYRSARIEGLGDVDISWLGRSI